VSLNTLVHDTAFMQPTLATPTQEGKPMNLATLLQNIQFVTDAQGQKQAVFLVPTPAHGNEGISAP